MIIYLELKRQFMADVADNQIDQKIADALLNAAGRRVSESEIASWRNSMNYMRTLLEDNSIPDDTGVGIEFMIPQTAKRIDFILSGLSESGEHSLVIVELKQWSNVSATNLDGIVESFVGSGTRNLSHPSYQAWTYAALLEDFNEAVQSVPVRLQPCAYLHNCTDGSAVRDRRYSAHLIKAPLFLRNEHHHLRDFIKNHVSKGDEGKSLYLVRDGKLRPSKGLSEHLVALLNGASVFKLIDEQKLVYETIRFRSQIATTQKRQVIIVNGGPGTGKSVVAINLLVELTRMELVTQYVTRNSAPREVYKSLLSGSLTKSRIDNLFKGSGAYIDVEAGLFDTLIVDEAHRLNEKSGMFAKGENQMAEIIRASKCSVFFIDPDQQVHWKDVGNAKTIAELAKSMGAVVTEMELASQFRCNGSDGYLAWVDNMLGIRETAHPNLEGISYDFRVAKDANELRQWVYELEAGGKKSRMVAGYTWPWKSQKDPHAYDLVLDGGAFKARWNLASDGMLWILKKESISEVGCIHTCQGLELDYVGVIFGEDFLVRNGRIFTDGGKRATTDKSIAGFKKLLKSDPDAASARASAIIRNTYRTLMTRGLKGCFVYSPDPETNAFLKAATGSQTAQANIISGRDSDSAMPFEPLDDSLVSPYVNALPLVDLKLAAGNFGPETIVQAARWVKPLNQTWLKKDHFICQVHGQSMNKVIPDGAWCLFRFPTPGSRKGKIVVASSGNIRDAETGARFTIKRYSSEKHYIGGDQWLHSKIILSPESFDEHFEPIILENQSDADFSIIGEFVEVLLEPATPEPNDC